jgi:F-type H+-transporting ATPase subunit epsilon
MAEGEKLDFELVSPEKLLVSEEADMVVVPGEEGDFGVLKGHMPMISTLRHGVIEVYQGQNVDQRIFVAGGFAEVTNARCTVLAEEAIHFSELSKEFIEERVRQAEVEHRDAEEHERAVAEDNLATAYSLRDVFEFYADR